MIFTVTELISPTAFPWGVFAYFIKHGDRDLALLWGVTKLRDGFIVALRLELRSKHWSRRRFGFFRRWCRPRFGFSRRL